jgi:hypothetical protein
MYRYISAVDMWVSSFINIRNTSSLDIVHGQLKSYLT